MTVGNLADRLRGIVKPVHPSPRESRLPAPPHGDDRGPDGLPAPHGHRIETVLGGEWRAAGPARSFVVERRQEREDWHGRVRIGALADGLQRAVSDAPLLANGAPARVPFVFFDLETTGLSGGAGTYAFLVGCGWFDESGAFVTRQHLLVRPSDERPMLQAVAQELAPAGALVSFNGRSFDAPLLETRFLYHRLPWVAGRIPHVDVLHPARRFWRSEALPGEASPCSLGALERQVLGAGRLNDVPGFEAPARYFQFVRSGDARPLGGILEHNRLDLLSLAGLTVHLLRLVHRGADDARDAREALALARIYDRAGLPARAADAYARALCLGQPDGSTVMRMMIKVEALRGLAHLERRSRRYDDAAARWRQILELPGCPAPVVREAAQALAIHHEHRVRDLESARAFTLRTLDVESLTARNAAVHHRLARIERKLGATMQTELRLELGD